MYILRVTCDSEFLNSHNSNCYSKRPKTSGSVSSVGTGYREKSPVPSALSPTPQVLGANMLQDALEIPRRGNRIENTRSVDENDEEADAGDDLEDDDHVDQEVVDDGNNGEARGNKNDNNDVENPVFAARNYGATIKSNLKLSLDAQFLII